MSNLRVAEAGGVEDVNSKPLPGKCRRCGAPTQIEGPAVDLAAMFSRILFKAGADPLKVSEVVECWDCAKLTRAEKEVEAQLRWERNDETWANLQRVVFDGDDKFAAARAFDLLPPDFRSDCRDVVDDLWRFHNHPTKEGRKAWEDRHGKRGKTRHGYK